MSPDPDSLENTHFALPPELVAQHPPPERDAARMLVVDRSAGSLAHSRVRDLADWLDPGDLLVVNATRVRAARLRGRKATGGAVEALLLEPLAEPPGSHQAWVRCSGHLREGLKLRFERDGRGLDAEIVALHGADGVALAFPPGSDPYELGEPPLPPYIRRDAPRPEDRERYQTVFARVPGSAAAPTAGLHLTDRIFAALRERGVERAELVLHVGLGTFRALRPEDLARGRLHRERFALPEETAAAVNRTRARGGRVVAVGTTTTRVLESQADGSGRVRSGEGHTELFLKPGSPIRVVDALLTNFHLPGSSLLMLVAAFIGWERLRAAYAEAIAERYRFFSYGDAMLVR